LKERGGTLGERAFCKSKGRVGRVKPTVETMKPGMRVNGSPIGGMASGEGKLTSPKSSSLGGSSGAKVENEASNGS